MSKPRDAALYKKVKARVYRKMPKHSAYRSGHLVQAYKKAFKAKHGPNKKPYIGKSSKPLRRWFKEAWRNSRGEVGYRKKGDVYRPTKRVSRKTPLTFKELKPSEIRAAKKQKARTGRVKRFRAK